ncbi:MAG: hypothetical protein J6K74_00465 [Marinifilaceae bacterium]|nr:hypothetical protein [Marinifilaceae bacterium]
MDNSKELKFGFVADVTICCVWFLLVGHEMFARWNANLVFLLVPLLRLWISFLIRRGSKVMIAPIVMLSVITLFLFVDNSALYVMFVEPWVTLVTLWSRFFSTGLIKFSNYPQLVELFSRYTIEIGLLSCIWMILYPLVICLYKSFRKQLTPGVMSIKKSFGLCAYIMGVTFFCSYIESRIVVVMAIAIFLLMLIPLIFNKGRVKDMFSRGEEVFILTLTMLAICYLCGIGIEQKAIIALGLFTVALYALVNRYFGRRIEYGDILLLLGASVIGWIAQYTTDMVRIILLITPLLMVTIPVMRFANQTKNIGVSVSLYVVIAVIIPLFSFGYNPYSVIDAGRGYHFTEYEYSKRGLLITTSNDGIGLRDRFEEILPAIYTSIDILTPSKPYCKVRINRRWQIFDIVRQEFVCDEFFDEVESCGELMYRLSSADGDKYLILPYSYHIYSEVQPAEITTERPCQ